MLRKTFSEKTKMFSSSSLKTIVANSRQNEHGNIAIMTAFMLPVVLLFFGGAIDFTRVNSVRTDLTESLDAAGLAVARLAETQSTKALSPSEQESFLKSYGTSLFLENFKQADSVTDLVVDFDITSTKITPSACGRLDTLVLEAAFSLLPSSNQDQFEYFDLCTDTEITRAGTGRVELALVLDVTGSMDNRIDGVKKIDSLRTSVDSLLDVLFGSDNTSEDVRVSVVPFNTHVNAGGSPGWNDDWSDENAESIYHGSNFFHTRNDGIVDTSVTVNHFDLYNSIPSVSWEGCVNSRPYPLDESNVGVNQSLTDSDITALIATPSELTNYASLSTAQRRTADAFNDAPNLVESLSELTATRNQTWVPMFEPDTPDCDRNDNICDNGINSQNNFPITVGSVVASLTYNRNRFDTPGAGGHTEDDYNSDYIDDELYIDPGQNPGDNFERYFYAVQQFRDTTQNGSVNPGLDDFLDGIGATSFAGDEYQFRTHYAGWWNPTTQTYNGKYDLTHDSGEDGPNRVCPDPILPLTSNKTTISDYVDDLVVAGGTNSAVGAVWGWRTLSAAAPFTDGINESDPEFGKWRKAVVIMTDGQNSFSRNRDTHLRTSISTYGYGYERRMGPNINDADEMEDESNKKLIRTCHRMKAEGILVYTVMFGLSNNAGNAARPIYQACATEPTDPYFFDIDDGDQLDTAFERIAADLVKLHISR